MDHVVGRSRLFVIRLAGQRHKGSLRKGMGKPGGCFKFYSILPKTMMGAAYHNHEVTVSMNYFIYSNLQTLH